MEDQITSFICRNSSIDIDKNLDYKTARILVKYLKNYSNSCNYEFCIC